jgi:pimeloyl-ACP methyl ester carboxylesterase
VFTGQADFDADKAANRKIYDDCRSHTGPLIDHVDSVSVARDIDAIRAAVGDRKLTFYGVSYGTLMGQMYAELYPDRIRAVTIDSNMDHSLGTAGFLLTEAATVQDSFDEFVKGCGADPGCVLHGTDIKALWASLLARAARGELHDPGAPDVAITPDLLIQFATGAFYGPTWRDLAATLQQLDAAATAAGPVAYDESLVGNSLQPQFCGDWSLPVRGYAEYAQLMKAQNLVAPDMRYSPVALTATAACLGWPAPVQNPQHALRVTHPSATLLELNNVHDPATAYAWALDAKLQLGPAARLLTYEGWGHGSYGRSACVTGAVDAYLVDGTLPAAGTHCAAVPPDAAAFAPHASSLPKGRF